MDRVKLIAMNIVSMLLVIAAATLLIGAGLLSLIRDLLGRGGHDAPLIEDDGRPPRSSEPLAAATIKSRSAERSPPRSPVAD